MLFIWFIIYNINDTKNPDDGMDQVGLSVKKVSVFQRWAIIKLMLFWTTEKKNAYNADSYHAYGSILTAYLAKLCQNVGQSLQKTCDELNQMQDGTLEVIIIQTIEVRFR